MDSPPDKVVRRTYLLTTFYHNKGKNASENARKINGFRHFWGNCSVE
jgi:hypothetical protein